MEIDNPQEEKSQRSPQQYGPRRDEIDLRDVWRVFLAQKWLILGITILCTALAIGVALMLPREYRAEVTLLPPLPKTIEKLNVPNVSGSRELYFFEVDAQVLYQELIDNLQSRQLRWQFFDDNSLARFLSDKEDNRTEAVIFEDMFSDKFVVSGLKKQNEEEGFVTITLEGKNPEQITDWLNDFVALADQETISGQTQSFSIKVQRVLNSVSQNIDSLRTVEKARVSDTIAQLKEALVVAGEIGLVGPGENMEVLYEQVKTNNANISFSLQELPLYLRGTKALEAEIDILQQRKNNDPFIEKLRRLQERYEFLSSMTQDAESVHAMRIDRPAIADTRPIKPKKKLIVVFGFVFGLFLSVVLAFIRNVIKAD